MKDIPAQQFADRLLVKFYILRPYFSYIKATEILKPSLYELLSLSFFAVSQSSELAKKGNSTCSTVKHVPYGERLGA